MCRPILNKLSVVLFIVVMAIAPPIGIFLALWTNNGWWFALIFTWLVFL